MLAAGSGRAASIGIRGDRLRETGMHEHQSGHLPQRKKKESGCKGTNDSRRKSELHSGTRKTETDREAHTHKLRHTQTDTQAHTPPPPPFPFTI